MKYYNDKFLVKFILLLTLLLLCLGLTIVAYYNLHTVWAIAGVLATGLVAIKMLHLIASNQ